MTDEELLATLTLQRTPHLGYIGQKKLIKHCGSALAVLKTSKSLLLKIDGIGTHKIQYLGDKNCYAKAEKELRFIKNNAINTLYFEDKDYPKYLKHCVDSPILITYRGNINWHTDKWISIVGTRKMTAYGKQFCRQLIEDLTLFKPTIVSGYAYGVDIYAHITALEYQLQTIACLAHGLNRIYPKVHQKYCNSMVENGGFITEFWSTDSPERENFLRRNRIIAGMSMATIVVESGERGGSLITADFAQNYNREVFAVPGRATDYYSQGCHKLIKQQKAHIITAAADLIYLLNWQVDNTPIKKVVQKELFVELDEEEQKIITFLQKKGKESLDIIALSCEMPIYKVSPILLDLEMKGLLRTLPGKFFEVL